MDVKTSMRVLTYIKYCTSVPNLYGNVNSSYSFASTPLHGMNMWITPRWRTPVPYSGQNKLPHINNIIKSGLEGAWRGLGGVGMGWPSTPYSPRVLYSGFSVGFSPPIRNTIIAGVQEELSKFKAGKHGLQGLIE